MIASTIEIKTAVLPCREMNTKNYVTFADFKSFQVVFIDFQVILLIIFTIFFCHQNPGPAHQPDNSHICFSNHEELMNEKLNYIKGKEDCDMKILN